MNELKYIYLLIEKCRPKIKCVVCLFSLILWSTGFGCSCLRYDRQTTPSAGIYARTGTDGIAREVLCCEFRRSRAGYTKGGSRGGGGYFFFFLWTKRRETCPQEGLWPTFIPARSFFFCYISLTSFLSLKEFSEFCQFDGEKLNGIVSSDAMAISCAQLRWRYQITTHIIL
jgi:hypothetical protein